jgi:Asp-tRNA(Asn)/Glu-tRNA(Gln) amidotransferase A subunit family amidase
MTSGFQGWKNYYPSEDAPLVKKIRAAGGIILAKSEWRAMRAGRSSLHTLPALTENIGPSSRRNLRAGAARSVPDLSPEPPP